MAVLLELPLAVVQRAHLTSAKPARNAVEVERVVAHSPGHVALLGGSGCLKLAVLKGKRPVRVYLIGLTFDAQVHDVVATDGAGVDDDVPRPQRNRVPLLHLKRWRLYKNCWSSL